MKPSSFYDRLVDVMEELTKFTLLLRDRQDYRWIATPSARSRRKSCPSESICGPFEVMSMSHPYSMKSLPHAPER